MTTIAIKPKILIAGLMVFCSVLLARSANTDDLNIDTGNYEYPQWRSVGNFGSLGLLATSILVMKSKDENDESEHTEIKKNAKKKTEANGDRTVEREDRSVSTTGETVQSEPVAVEEKPEEKNYFDNSEFESEEDETDDETTEGDNEPDPDTIASGFRTMVIPPESNPIADIAKRGHRLLPCSTQSGKTTTIQAAMLEVWQKENGNVDFWVLDAKGSSFLGIEKNPSRYLLVESPDDIDRAIYFITSVETIRKARMKTRQKIGGRWSDKVPKRLVLILEEFNNVISFADICDRLETDKKQVKRADQMGCIVTMLLNLASEDYIDIWITGQSHRVGAIRLNQDTKDNLDFFCQGRNGNYQSITRAIVGQGSLVKQQKERDRLLTELEECVAVAAIENRPIVFSTLGGFKVRILPDLKGVEKNVLFTTENDANAA